MLSQIDYAFFTQNFRGSVDPFKVKAVDTTGAGDSFVGALLCKIVDDQSVLQVLSYSSIEPIFIKMVIKPDPWNDRFLFVVGWEEVEGDPEVC